MPLIRNSKKQEWQEKVDLLFNNLVKYIILVNCKV